MPQEFPSNNHSQKVSQSRTVTLICSALAQRLPKSKLSSANTETSKIRLSVSLFISDQHWPVNTQSSVGQLYAAVHQSRQVEIIKDRSFQPLDFHTKIEEASGHIHDLICMLTSKLSSIALPYNANVCFSPMQLRAFQFCFSGLPCLQIQQLEFT